MSESAPTQEYRGAVALGSAWWDQATDPAKADARTPTRTALDVLTALVASATAIPDPVQRSRELASLERVLADPRGILRQLREARTATYRERLAAGETRADLAAAEGISQQRVARLVMPRREQDPATQRAAHAAAVALRTERDREARASEAADWLERVETRRVTVQRLASRMGLSEKTIRARLREARAARDAAADAEASALAAR